jgi:ABC-type dipeptide/oligopeptide/nickel transport system ATPase component
MNHRDAEDAAVLAVLHDLNLAAAAADRVAVLSRGRLAALGRPWQAFTESLLSEVFDHPMSVMRHPARDCPLIVPLPRTLPGCAQTACPGDRTAPAGEKRQYTGGSTRHVHRDE